MSKSRSGVSRRHFMHGLGVGVAGSLLAGCGASGSDGGVFGSSGTGVNTNSNSSVAGAINTSQIGGSPLTIVSGRQAAAAVDYSGNVTVVTPDSAAQILFAVDASGNLRGLTLKIPGQPLALDATSTALALTFLVPGLVTTDPRLASERANLLKAAPSFNALVQRLISLLPNDSLTSILPQIQALLEAVIQEVTGPIVTPKVFTAAQAASARPGGIYVTAGSELNPANGSFTINNESFRYVSVVRQFFTARGKSAQSERTNLIGAPLGNAVSVVGAVNGYSVGNLATGQVLSASNARDDFSLLNHDPILEHVTYYLRGLGYAGHSDNVTLPDDVSVNLFEDKADLLTLLLSVLYPLIEVTLGVASFARFGEEALVNLLGQGVSQGSAVNASTNTVAAANTGDPKNVAAAFLDAFNALLTTPQFADELALLLGEGLLASVVAAGLEITALALSTANFLATAIDVVNRPRIAAIEVPVPMVAFFAEVGAAPDFNVLLDVNTQGTLTYQATDGNVYRKKPFATPVSLGGPISAARLSDENDLTTFQNQAGTIFLRNDLGVTGTVPLPAGLNANPFGGGPFIDPKGTAVAAQATVAADNRPEIFLFQRSTGESISLESNRVRAGGLFLGGINADTVFARGAIGGTSSQLARYDRTTGDWTSRTLSSSPFSNFRLDYRGVNRIGEALLSDYRENDDGFNPVSSIEKIVVETFAGLETVYEGGLPASGGGTRPEPVGINDEGEILAVLYTYNANRNVTTEETVLFKRRGGSSQSPLSSLFPAGMPAGTYRGLGLAGKYVVVTRLDNGAPGTNYLVFLGRSVADVQQLLGMAT